MVDADKLAESFGILEEVDLDRLPGGRQAQPSLSSRRWAARSSHRGSLAGSGKSLWRTSGGRATA